MVYHCAPCAENRRRRSVSYQGKTTVAISIEGTIDGQETHHLASGLHHHGLRRRKRHHDATVSIITRAGTVSALAILLLAFFFSYCMHMMLAELTMGVGKGTQIVGIFQHYLFRGRFGKALTMGMFVLVTLVLIFNLAAYVAGGAEILPLRMPPLAAKIVFYAIAAAVVFFGLKVLGISEAISIEGTHYRHHRHSGRRKHVHLDKVPSTTL